MPKPAIKFARDTVSVRERGSKYPTAIQKGSAWYADHPIVVDHPDLFADTPTDVFPRGWTPSPVVEQATAAPGEKRTARRTSDD
jgi:hypothetical protein